MKGQSSGNILSSTFSNNAAPMTLAGGAVSLGSGAGVEINDCTFTGNNGKDILAEQ